MAATAWLRARPLWSEALGCLCQAARAAISAGNVASTPSPLQHHVKTAASAFGFASVFWAWPARASLGSQHVPSGSGETEATLGWATRGGWALRPGRSDEAFGAAEGASVSKASGHDASVEDDGESTNREGLLLLKVRA